MREGAAAATGATPCTGSRAHTYKGTTEAGTTGSAGSAGREMGGGGAGSVMQCREEKGGFRVEQGGSLCVRWGWC